MPATLSIGSLATNPGWIDTAVPLTSFSTISLAREQRPGIAITPARRRPISIIRRGGGRPICRRMRAMHR